MEWGSRASGWGSLDPRAVAHRALRPGGASHCSPAAGFSAPRRGLGLGTRLPAAELLLHGLACRRDQPALFSNPRPPSPGLEPSSLGARGPALRGRRCSDFSWFPRPDSGSRSGSRDAAPGAHRLEAAQPGRLWQELPAPGANPSDWLGHSRRHPLDDRASSLPARRHFQPARLVVGTSGTSPLCVSLQSLSQIRQL